MQVRPSCRAIYLAALLSLCAARISFAQSLGVQGTHLTVNGAPKFLTFVSYFDAMRRASSSIDGSGNPAGDLDADFAYFRNQGYDGIRIFPNWWHYACGGSQSSMAADDDALFTTTVLRETKWPVFLYVLNKAAANGLLVDVSFTRETLTESNNDIVSVAHYADQIADVADRLKGGYDHVLFDLQNERTNALEGISPPTPVLTASDIESIASTVRNADQARLLTASTGAGLHEEAGDLAEQAELSLVAVHPRRATATYTWSQYETLVAAVSGAETGMGTPYRPIYMQEPMPFSRFPGCSSGDYDPDVDHHANALYFARYAGAAAWTFHTRLTFDLSSERYIDLLENATAEAEALEFLNYSLAQNIAPLSLTFTDDPLSAGSTPIKRVHISELRVRVDSLRAYWNMPRNDWTDTSLVPGVTTAKAVHLQELRDAVDALYEFAETSHDSYAEAISAGTTVRLSHIAELRSFIEYLEDYP